MMVNSVQAIILAAGKSSRFKTGKTKLLEKICGQEMILYTTRLLTSMNIPTTVITGFQKEAIQECIIKFHGGTVQFVTQEEQLGTGHALVSSRSCWKEEHVLIINGDIPLITAGLITELYTKHITTDAVISFITAHNVDPKIEGYGRIVEENGVIEIIEAKHFTGDTTQHCCINAGIYLIKRSFLEQSIHAIAQHETGKEFYLTDIVKIASLQKRTVTMVVAPFDVVRGINTLQELWTAEQIKRGELIRYWMDNGVRFSVAQNVHIDLDVVIGAGAIIGCGVHLLGKTTIGQQSVIHEFSSVENCTIGDNSAILPHCFIKDSLLGNRVTVGPFAHVHTNSYIGDDALIGNFVEVKKTRIASHTKAKHLAYLGDAYIGSHVNIGAGTVICNHNGITKNSTTIHDNAFIGSNSTLIAPVTIGDGAFTAAGSTITSDVPTDALAIGRTPQVTKEGYAHKIREKRQKNNDVPQSPCIDDCTLPTLG